MKITRGGVSTVFVNAGQQLLLVDVNERRGLIELQNVGGTSLYIAFGTRVSLPTSPGNRPSNAFEIAPGESKIYGTGQECFTDSMAVFNPGGGGQGEIVVVEITKVD